MNENQNAEAMDAKGILEILNRTVKNSVETALSRILSKPERGYMSLKNGALYSDLSEKTLRRFHLSRSTESIPPSSWQSALKEEGIGGFD